jgi:pimeloyl-ACP methyl ester carboxylesterase
MAASPGPAVHAPDGTRIATFVSGDGPPVVLVHGAASDHTTFRVVEPILAARHAVHAIDRRGRGASGDGARYEIEREFDDLAAVVDAVAAESGRGVDVVGHSFGGRVGLGAALRTSNLRRLVVYEGAPAPAGTPYQAPDLLGRLRSLADAGRNEELLSTFLAEVIGMTGADLAAYRVNPVWPARVAAAPTIVREIEAEGSAAAGLDALGGVGVPVLQILGGASRPAFRSATEALQERLADGRIAVIEGAKHGAHHSHPDRFVAEVERFLAAR